MIRLFDPGLEQACREFLDRSPRANYCHDPAWAEVIREAYGKEAFTYVRTDPITGEVKGMAPACHLASTAFGRSLVCLPYLDYGGILAADAETEDLLRDKLLAEAQSRRSQLEIRSRDPLCGLPAPQDEKAAMILPLRGDSLSSEDGDWSAISDDLMDEPMTSEAYWNGLDAKVRNQVRKAVKSGVSVVWGREERLDDFYDVFCVNMRDLGSPTHAKGFFAAVLKHFPGAGIGTAHREGKCIGGLFRILWKDELAIPWASTLKEDRIHCPNNALYWESLLYAFEQGCRRVDFGRSTRDEGTYRFKKQWGVQELPLYRYQFDEKGHFLERSWHVSQGKLGWTRNVWAKLPLKLANSLGPMLRGSISA
jgi:serine/alanine adding enzyme